MKSMHIKRTAVCAIALSLMGWMSAASANHIGLDLTSPDGNYYVYSTAGYSSLGVSSSIYDVDSFGNYIYANIGNGTIARWTVGLSGGTDPNLHPDNPYATGTMVTRTFSAPTFYINTGIGYISQSEIYATADALYFRNSGGPWGGMGGDLYRYDLGTGITTLELTSAGSFLAYDDVNGVWYTGHEGNRGVYSWNGAAWVLEFTYDSMAGSHMDGMEFINGSMFVSDMTSDYILQAKYNSGTGGWDKVNLFKYNDPTGTVVEGMGFGAFDHFWVGAGSNLIEIGGGELQQEIEKVPEPATLALLGLGLVGLGFSRKKQLT